MNHKYTYLLLFTTLIVSCGKFETDESSSPPNIIYILADDMGYGDVSVLNEHSKIQTPNIDRLAAQGIYFTDAHSPSSVCTPTRYGILTGRYAWRSTLKEGVTWSYDAHLIDTGRLTVASMLKEKGYHTACIGKWHLGLDWTYANDGNINFFGPIGNGPLVLGFDYFFGITASLDIPPYFYIENDRITATQIDTIEARSGKEFWREGPIGNDFKHIEVLPTLTEKAIRYIEERSTSKKSFFLYFPLPAPHTPIIPTDEFLGRSGTNEYGDFVLMVDNVVGQIMNAVRSNGIENNTILIFTSDNGCSPMADFAELAEVNHFPSYHFRGHKADIFDGGHRVPFIVQWPENITPGRSSQQIISLTDLMATCAELLEINIPENAAEDSYSFLGTLTGTKVNKSIRPAVVHHSINGSYAIRQDDWKLNFCPGSGGWSQPTPEEARKTHLPDVQLYNMHHDFGEKVNAADQHPEIVQRLTNLMESYIKEGRSTPGTKQTNEGITELFQPDNTLKE